MPDNKIAMVTGAGSGIGRSAALALQGDGWSVVLAGRRVEALDETAGMAEGGGGEMLAVPTDVTDEAAVDRLFAAAKDRFGRLDLLFNNAGMAAPPVPMENLDVAIWKSVVDVNLTACFVCAQHAIRIMKAQDPQGGRIINNGSISAHVPRPNTAPYTATKHAITGLTRSISLDGRKHNIACGQIDIGNALTGLAEVFTKGVPQADGSIKPEPVMDVAHIGEAVLHMANLPLDANIQFMTIMATQMPFIGRG